MLLTSLTITDLAAFQGTVTFPLHAVTLIQGDHGKGKSSIGEVLCYAFGRRPLAESGSVGIRHDPSILHGNAERGQAEITFDDGSVFRVSVTSDSTTRSIKLPDATKWNKATPEFIDSLVNALSYDPFVYKTLPEKQRIEALLKASPVTVTLQEITEAVGADLEKYIQGAPSLETINATHAVLYDYRRTANVAAEKHAAHATETESKLPKDPLAAVDVAPLRQQREALELGERDLIEKCRKHLDTFKAQAQSANDSRKTTVDKEINAKISLLEAERTQRHGESDAQYAKDVEVLRDEANTAVMEHRTATRPDVDRLTAEIATAEERAQHVGLDQQLRAIAKSSREQEAKEKADSTRINAAMDRLTVLKNAVAAKLAIPGVTIASPRPGQPVDICRTEGDALVPFSRWNEADKERFCLRMAVLFHGKCGMVFVDEIGHFTEERRKGIIEAAHEYAKSSGMQFIMGLASEGGLRVVEG